MQILWVVLSVSWMCWKKHVGAGKTEDKKLAGKEDDQRLTDQLAASPEFNCV